MISECACVFCEGCDRAGKCEIEVGESTGRGSFQQWWWSIHPSDCKITGDKVDYRSRSSAVRAARRCARRYSLEVECVYECGKEPD